MKRYETGHPTSYGIYISPRSMDIRFVGADGEALEGRRGATYFRLPTWLVVVLGPALGGAFVLAFPLLVLAAVIIVPAVAIGRKVSERHAYVARGGWQPAAAYFKKDGEVEADEAAPELRELEAEVAKRAEAEKAQNN